MSAKSEVDSFALRSDTVLDAVMDIEYLASPDDLTVKVNCGSASSAMVGCGVGGRGV